MLVITGKYNSANVMIDDIEDEARSQIQSFLNHPDFQGPPIVIQPDTHCGKGSVIGFTMPLTGRSIGPAIVGVDIGCGMYSVNIGKPSLNFEKLHRAIESRIPHGMETHGTSILEMESDSDLLLESFSGSSALKTGCFDELHCGFPWSEANCRATAFATAFEAAFGQKISHLKPVYSDSWFAGKCGEVNIDLRRCRASLGSLGSGNHFIEVDIAPNGDHWLTVHSGSRNFGLKICNHWMENGAQIFSQEPGAKVNGCVGGSGSGKKLTGSQRGDGFTFLQGAAMAGYFFDMIFAQIYASVNRRLMALQLIRNFGWQVVDEVETVHNYIDFEDLIVRKGAIAARTGQRVIIPFNMSFGIAVARGLGNSLWNCSAPHGAGRLMSRSKARKFLSLDEFRKRMSHVHSWCVNYDTLDESPMAYKNPAAILRAISPTVELEFLMKPVFNFKDGGKGVSGRRK
jgi:RNA-splicing ligase RtcB